jgi:hypothetical protein
VRRGNRTSVERCCVSLSLSHPSLAVHSMLEAAERWGEQTFQNVPRRLFRWMTVRRYAIRRRLADEAGIPLGALIARPSLQARVSAAFAWAAALVPPLPGPVPSGLPPEWLAPMRSWAESGRSPV